MSLKIVELNADDGSIRLVLDEKKCRLAARFDRDFVEDEIGQSPTKNDVSAYVEKNHEAIAKAICWKARSNSEWARIVPYQASARRPYDRVEVVSCDPR